MFNKIKDGFLTGLGFGIGLLFIYSFYMMFIWPAELERTMKKLNESANFYGQHMTDEIDVKVREVSPFQNKPNPIPRPDPRAEFEQFHNLSLDQKIDVASAIAIGTFQEAEDGRHKAIITEFLKKEPNIDLYYNVGDEYPHMSSYPNERGDKSEQSFILFFAGNPPMMRTGMTYHGDRISGLNDIPVKLLREKCNPPSSADPNN
jgi:hypothetical protein